MMNLNHTNSKDTVGYEREPEITVNHPEVEAPHNHDAEALLVTEVPVSDQVLLSGNCMYDDFTHTLSMHDIYAAFFDDISIVVKERLAVEFENELEKDISDLTKDFLLDSEAGMKWFEIYSNAVPEKPDYVRLYKRFWHEKPGFSLAMNILNSTLLSEDFILLPPHPKQFPYASFCPEFTRETCSERAAAYVALVDYAETREELSSLLVDIVMDGMSMSYLCNNDRWSIYVLKIVQKFCHIPQSKEYDFASYFYLKRRRTETISDSAVYRYNCELRTAYFRQRMYHYILGLLNKLHDSACVIYRRTHQFCDKYLEDPLICNTILGYKYNDSTLKLIHDIELNPGPVDICQCVTCVNCAKEDVRMFAIIIGCLKTADKMLPIVEEHFKDAHGHRLQIYAVYRDICMRTQGDFDLFGVKKFANSLVESSSKLSGSIVESTKIFESITDKFQDGGFSRMIDSLDNFNENFGKVSEAIEKTSTEGIGINISIDKFFNFLNDEKLAPILLLITYIVLEILDRVLEGNSCVKIIKYMVGIYGLVKVAKGPITDLISKWIIPIQQSDDDISWIDLVIQGIGFGIFGSKLNLTGFSSFVKSLSDIERGYENVSKLVKNVQEWFMAVMKKMCVTFNISFGDWFTSPDNRLKDIQKECTALLDKYIEDPMCVDMQFNNELTKLAMKVNDMISTTPVNHLNTPINIALNRLQDKVYALQRNASDAGIGAGERDEPGFIPIAGAPGVGKTYFSDFLAQSCAISLCSEREMVDALRSWKSQIYVWPVDNKHHDQYMGQHVIIFPDLFAATDAEGMPSEAVFLIYLVGGQPLPLPAAEITKKQRLWCVSGCIIACTNTVYIHDGMFKSMRNSDALKRRLNEFGWYMYVNPTYALLDSSGQPKIDAKTHKIKGYESDLYLYAMLDKSKLPDVDGLVEDCWLFRRLNFSAGKFVDNKIYTQMQFLDLSISYIRNKKQSGIIKRQKMKVYAKKMVDRRQAEFNGTFQSSHIEACVDKTFEDRELLLIQREMNKKKKPKPQNNDEEFHDVVDHDLGTSIWEDSVYYCKRLYTCFKNKLLITGNYAMNRDHFLFIQSKYREIIGDLNERSVGFYEKVSEFYECLESKAEYMIYVTGLKWKLLVFLAKESYEVVNSNILYWFYESQFKNVFLAKLNYLRDLCRNAYVEISNAAGLMVDFCRTLPYVGEFLDTVGPCLRGVAYGVGVALAIEGLIYFIDYFVPIDGRRNITWEQYFDSKMFVLKVRHGNLSVFVDDMPCQFEFLSENKSVFIILTENKTYIFSNQKVQFYNKYIKPKPVEQQAGWFDNNTDHSYISKYLDNVYLLYIRRIEKTGRDHLRHPCNCVFLGERTAVLVDHVVLGIKKTREVFPDDIIQIELVPFSGGLPDTTPLVYRYEDVCFPEDKRLSSIDLGIFKLKSGKLHPRIEKLIPPKKCLDYLSSKKDLVSRFIKKPTNFMTPLGGTQQIFTRLNFKQEKIIYDKTISFKDEMTGEIKKYNMGSLSAHGCSLQGIHAPFITEDGDCSSPCFIVDERKNFCVNMGWSQAAQPWLVYLHTSISGIVPLGVPIYRELFEVYFNEMFTNILPTSDSILENLKDHESVLLDSGVIQQSSLVEMSFENKPLDDVHTSVITMSECFNVPHKTEIRRSDIYGFKPVTRYPARLKDFINKEGNLVRVMQNARQNYGSNRTCFNEMMITAISNDVASLIMSKSNKTSKTELLSFEQCLYGDPGYNLSPVNMDSSPGFYFRIMKNHFSLKKASGKRFMQDDAYNLLPVFDKITRDLFVRGDLRVLSGQRLGDVFIDNLKDELLKLEKVVKGNTRLFCASTFISILLFRKYFGAFSGWIYENRIKNGIAVGINPYSNDWDGVYDHLNFNSDDCIFGDYGKYDKRLKDIIMKTTLYLAHMFYNDFGTPEFVAREMLFEDLIYSVHVVSLEGKLYFYTWEHGNTSGNFLTAVLNSISNITIVFVAAIYCWFLSKNIDPMKAVPCYKFSFFSDRIEYQTLGDDLVVSVRDLPFFTFNSMKYSVEKYLGLEFTDELKGGGKIPDYRPIIDGSFLGRRFVLGTYYGKRKIYAPLRMYSVVECVQWIKGIFDPEIEISKFEGLNLELVQHGEAVFNENVPEYAEICHRAYGKYPKYTSYISARDRVVQIACYLYSFDTFFISDTNVEEDSKKLNSFLSFIESG